MHQGLLHADHLFIDSTHVKASANKGKYDKKVVRKETRAYEEKLQLELNMEMTKAIENELLDGFCLQSETTIFKGYIRF